MCDIIKTIFSHKDLGEEMLLEKYLDGETQMSHSIMWFGQNSPKVCMLEDQHLKLVFHLLLYTQ